MAGTLTRIRNAVEREAGRFLPRQRWFGAKARTIQRVAVLDATTAPGGADRYYALVIVDVLYADGGPDRYFLPLALRNAAAVRDFLPTDAPEILARLDGEAGDELLFDAVADPDFCRILPRSINAEAIVSGDRGWYQFRRVPGLTTLADLPLAQVDRVRAEQSNSSIVYDRTIILKAFRRLEAGENPDVEIGRFLTTKTDFRNVPRVHGTAEFRSAVLSASVAVAQDFVPNQGDGWHYTLANLRTLLERAAADRGSAGVAPERLRDWLGGYFAALRRLGSITGQLHQALASNTTDPDFAPEPIVPADLAQWAAAIEADLTIRLSELRHAVPTLDETAQQLAGEVASREGSLRARIAALASLADAGLTKTRYHGDYHLGQVLWTGSDFILLDFEGEPARPLDKRRAKHTPLKDVAGLLRSLNYAHATARAWPDAAQLTHWSEVLAAWERLARDEILAGYRAETGERGASFAPRDPDRLTAWVGAFELEKAIYELGYELNNRPDWVAIPLSALLR